MSDIGTIWAGFSDLIDRGGPIILVIMGVTLVMWSLIIERAWYLKIGHQREAKRVIKHWQCRVERKSWSAQSIRYALISELAVKLNRSLGLIGSLVTICPLLGLLGTVTGMIEVFDVMANLGSGNPRAMAAGVSRATIPTLAGMVVALSGYYLNVRLRRSAAAEIQNFANRLTVTV
jgi:biopolymer transport protein ExbB